MTEPAAIEAEDRSIREEIARLRLTVHDEEQAFRTMLGDRRVVERSRVRGGDISEAFAILLSDGARLFMKRHALSVPGLFVEELRGLLALRSTLGPYVPRPLALFETQSHQFLVMEFLEPGSAADWEAFGRALSALHRERRAPQCGFFQDNTIGGTPQSNPWTADWATFFAESRLLPQIERAARSGLADRNLVQSVERVAGRLKSLLPDVEHGGASLVHGDLWAGNVVHSRQHGLSIVDPAAYYGHREADLAMTSLFGGFPSDFYAAYHEAWQTERGFEQRIGIYNLYHMLNHLNLFGRGYASQCQAMARPFR